MDRNGICDQFVTLFQASAYNYIKDVDNDAIAYSEKNPLDTKTVRYNKEIWIAPGNDSTSPISVAKESHAFHVYAVILVKGHAGSTDKKAAVKIAEACERILLENRTLPSSLGTIRNTIDMDFAHHFGRSSTLNFAFLDVIVDKITFVD